MLNLKISWLITYLVTSIDEENFGLATLASTNTYPIGEPESRTTS